MHRDIVVTSRNGDRRVMQSIRITGRPLLKIRKWNQLSQFRWMSTKVIPIEKTPLLRSERKVSSFWEVIVLLAYASLAASRTLLQQLLVCPNFPLYSEDLYCWLKTTKVIPMNCHSSTSSWKPWRWVRLDLILLMIYINFSLNLPTKFMISSRSNQLKDVFQWKISQMIMKTILISTRIVISYSIKLGMLFWDWWKVSGNLDNNIIRISQWRESHCRANTSIKR